MTTAFSAQLKDRIRRQYDAGGYVLGWKLLYSPEAVLEGARVAFIGLNPGGSVGAFSDDANFSVEGGSSYAVEIWEGESSPGASKLQRQVLALFRMIGERPEAVLAGNLVPFRSPSWEKLHDKKRALAFGEEIWRDILAKGNPQLVVCMGVEVFSVLRTILNVRETERVSVGWGDICGERGEFASGALVRIPHLSRFAIITRTESQPGLRKLLPG